MNNDGIREQIAKFAEKHVFRTRDEIEHNTRDYQNYIESIREEYKNQKEKIVDAREHINDER